MDAITYFLLNYGLYSLLLVTPAALLGVAFGWLTWGKHQAGAEEARKRREAAERAVAEVEMMLSKEREQFRKYREAAESEGVAPAPGPELERELAELRAASERAEKQIEEARRKREDAERELAAVREEKEGLEKERPVRTGKSGAEQAGIPKAEWKKFKAEKRELEKRLAAHEKAAGRKCAELEKKLAASEAERDRKAGEALERQEAVAVLRAELKETRIGLEGELRETKSRLEAELKETRATLEGELKQARSRIERESRAAEAKLKEAAKAREDQARKAGREIADLKQAQAGVEEELGGVEKQRDGMMRELAALQKEREELAEKLKQETDLRFEEREKTAENIDTLLSKQEELKAQLDSLANQKKQATDDLERLSQERAELRSKVTEAQSGAAVAEARWAEVSGDKKGLEEDLAATREERAEARAALEAMRVERSALEAHARELEERVAQAGRDLEDLAGARSSLEEQLGAAQSKAAMVEVDLEMAQQECEAARQELAAQRVVEQRWADELHRLREEKVELNKHIAMLGGDNRAEVLINQIKAEKDRLAHDLADQQNERQQVEDAVGVLRRELHGLRHELVEAEARAKGLTEAKEQLRVAEERLARTQLDLNRAMEERRRLAGRTEELERRLAAARETEQALADELDRIQTAPPAPVARPEPGSDRVAADDLRAAPGAAPDGRSGGGIEPAAGSPEERRREESLPGAEAGREGQKAGDAPPDGPEGSGRSSWSGPDEELYRDPRLGVLYRAAPAESDDLTVLKGVGEVIGQKLNEAGIYTYRQVAKWRPSQVKAISQKLKLRDRVKRDDWQKQARMLHKAKYGDNP